MANIYAEYVQHALALFGSDTDFCVFDLETTDKLNGPDAKVMQLAARRYRYERAGNRVILLREMNVLINDPTMTTVAEGALNTHHIELADCHQADNPSPKEAWDYFLAMADNATLMGQNIIDFDIPFANRELARHNFRRSLNPGRAIDTLLIARQLWSKKTGFGAAGFKLRSLAKDLNVQTDPALDHNALGDIDTTWKVWLAMQPYMTDYRRKFIEGEPDQYKRMFGGLDARWRSEVAA